jgi:hypothetical protein
VEKDAVGNPRAERARFEQALLMMAGRESAPASLVFYGLESTSDDSLMKRRAAYFGGLCALEQERWAEARGCFRQALRDSLTCPRPEIAQRLDALLGRAEKMRPRSSAKAKLLSTFLPGAGQVYAGSFWNGLNALGLNVLGGYWLAHSIRQKEWGEVGLNLLLFLGRYYAGNRYQAATRAERTNSNQTDRLRNEAVRLARDSVIPIGPGS